jgi:lipid-binding SYLF domain-containing protein
MIRASLLRLAWLCVFVAPAAIADDYSDTIAKFRKATEAQGFFENAYGYAVFPTVGKGGFFVGGAFGRGQVYVGSAVTGDTSLSQISFGFQLGGEAFSEIIFFKNKAAYDDFASGKLRFSAQAQAVAIVAGAQAQTGSTGTSSGAGVPGGMKQFRGVYNNGMAVFTYIKGGLMYEASVAGQKFTFEPK